MARVRAPRRRRRVSVFGVIGEIMVTAGVITMLFVVWQMWIGDAIIGAGKKAEAAAISQQWENDALTAHGGKAGAGQPVTSGNIPVPAQPKDEQVFGVMYIPRFGSDWHFTIAGGVSHDGVLNKGEIGHYTDSALPGQIGNTAYAAHRWTAGAPFDAVNKLVAGDAIVIQTKDGWYTYRFRNLEYVQATQTDVLLAVPQRTDLAATGRYLTLTSCAPKFNIQERIINYAVFESFTPAADGRPAVLSEKVS